MLNSCVGRNNRAVRKYKKSFFFTKVGFYSQKESFLQSKVTQL